MVAQNATFEDRISWWMAEKGNYQDQLVIAKKNNDVSSEYKCQRKIDRCQKHIDNLYDLIQESERYGIYE